jgi:hypothetical protein
MITKFDTTASAASSNKSGKGMSIITIGIIAVAAYAGYRFILKPYLDNKKPKDNE